MPKKAVAIKLRKFSKLDAMLGEYTMLCKQCLCHICKKTEKDAICTCYFRRRLFDVKDHRWRDLCAQYIVSECVNYEHEGGD